MDDSESRTYIYPYTVLSLAFVILVHVKTKGACACEREGKEDVKHYLMDCMEYMHLKAKVERSIMEEGKVTGDY